MSKSLHFVPILTAGRDYVGNTWKLPGSPIELKDRLEANFETAKIAEEGKLDAILYADIVFGTNGEFWKHLPPGDFEALTLLTAIAERTNQLGVIPSLSTTYDIPFQVARRVLSLDHISDGRAGWNVVATFSEQLARAVAGDSLPKHLARYQRADEFTSIVTSLWDGFEEDSTVADASTGIFTDPEKVHTTEFHGEHFNVSGLLGQTRSTQGRPVLFQAGSSEHGVEFAAKHAEVVFTSQKTLESSLEFTNTLRDKAFALGRETAPLTLPGLTFVLGSTEEEANRIEREYLDAVIPEVWLGSHYATTFFAPEHSATLLDDLDAPLPPFLDSVEGYQTAFNIAKQQASEKNFTVRDFLHLTLRGDQFAYWVGTPEKIAAEIERWFTAGAADGFIFVLFHNVNAELKKFTDHVVPILQRKGIFREDYEGDTLRSHLGLEIPANSFTASRVGV